MESRVGVVVEDVPEAVHAAVEADAALRNKNRNDVVCEILADRYRVRYTPTDYPYQESESRAWNLRMPVDLREAIRAAVREGTTEHRKLSQRGLVIAALQAHYDLPVDSPRRRPSQEPLDAALVREARARHEAGESFRELSKRYGVRRDTLAKAIRAVA